MGDGFCALLLAATTLALCACASHTGLTADKQITLETGEFRVLWDQVYTPEDWPEPIAADVYIPQRSGPHPAVLVVHGGGWERRKRQDMDEIASYLARHGFVAVNISYRFAPAHRWPAQLHDLQQAMRWIHQHAAKLQVDTDRIGGFGYSAGAHLVTLLGVIDDGDPLDQPYGGRATRIQAVVAGGTPSDLRVWPDGDLTTQLMGSSYGDNPDAWDGASPITHVTEGDAPTFLYHGGIDTLVSPDQAKNLKAAMDRAGVPVELYVVPYLGHISMFTLNNSAIREATRFLGYYLRR
ncbi:MAG: alpha/beta hydrolase [Xanthomonadales bacterium]|nr:alpha/beta hydrolase [Xanthomonadales bacterium]